MPTNYLEEARKRMRSAGADAFHLGKPNVPGLDVLWARELIGPRGTGLSCALADSWRFGWKAQAALVERIVSKRPCAEMAFDGFTFFACSGGARHEGECRP